MSTPAVQTRARVPRLAEAAVERARLTVVPRGRSRAARMPFVTLVSLVLVGGIIGLLLFNTSMQQASFAATSLEAQADTLAARQQTLTMELEELRNPQRVAQEAQKMGMVIPAAPAFLELDGTVTGQPTVAAPDQAISLAPRQVVKPAALAPAPTIVKERLTRAEARAARAEERAAALAEQAAQQKKQAKQSQGQLSGRGNSGR